MSHQNGGGAELSTSLSLSQASWGSSGEGSPPSLQDIPPGRGKGPGCGRPHLGTHLRNAAQSTCGCLGLTRKNEKQISGGLCGVLNICYFR